METVCFVTSAVTLNAKEFCNLKNTENQDIQLLLCCEAYFMLNR